MQEQSLHSKGGEYCVDWKVVRSKEYTRRFDVLSGNTKANELAAQRCRNALVNRDGKKTEEIYAISLTSGKDIAKITDQHNEFGVMRTQQFDDKVSRAESKGELVLLIHNHPRGFPPSVYDINELMNHENAVGITAGHDGSIYYYTRPIETVSEDDFWVAEKHFSMYNNDVVRHEKALELLGKKYGFVIRRL